MIPRLVDIGAPWKVLPKGIHDSDIDEIKSKFAYNQQRKKLFKGLKMVIEAFKKAGCKTLYINGSFVTEKENPNDFDICWETKGVDLNKLDPVLIDFSDGRKRQKTKYLGECFPLNFIAGPGRAFIDFFQLDKFTGKAKGIIRLTI